MSENLEHKRGFIIAEIYLGGVWHYLIDVEHKCAGELSMLFIRAQSGDRINARRFDYFMEAVAKHNGWQAAKEFNSHWRFATIRQAKLRDADALAILIQKSLRKSGQPVLCEQRARQFQQIFVSEPLKAGYENWALT